MDLCKWCAEYVRTAWASGDPERAELFGYFERSRLLWDRDPEAARQLLQNGRHEAHRLGEPWWEMLYEHWQIELMTRLGEWDLVRERAARAALEVRKSTYDGFPARLNIQEELVGAYAGSDPMLYERQIREALGYLERNAGLDPEIRIRAGWNRVWLEMSLDRHDDAEVLSLRQLALTESAPGYQPDAYYLLCELMYRRGDWMSLGRWAGAGEEAARPLGLQRHLAEFLQWRAVTARVSGDERAAARLHRHAAARIKLVEAPSPLYRAGIAAYYEVGGEMEKALDVRGYRKAPTFPRGIPAWQEANYRLRLCQLLAHMDLPLEPTLSGARETARRMGVPAFMHAKLDRIERDVAEGCPGPPYSWQRGENYVDY